MRLQPLAWALAFAVSLPGFAARDYVKEVQANQFRPHGGDKQEIADFFTALVKAPGSVDKAVAADASPAATTYVRDLGRFADLKLVGTSVEKLYTVSGVAPYQNYRAIARFKFQGRLGGKLIERTDYLGMARLGKLPTDWRIWGVVWQDSGIDVSDASLAQLDKPRLGEEICVMTTEAGVIRMRLFPDKAPKAVKNFKALAAQGFYDNRPFLRVYPDFMIQGGALDGTKEYDVSSYGKLFEDEFARDLFNFRGALCMGNVGPDTNGNQFYIVQSPKVVPEHLELSALPLNAKAKYQELGGRPYLDMRYTVFGQVYEGIEAVDAIARQKADDDGKPVEKPIKILTVTFQLY